MKKVFPLHQSQSLLISIRTQKTPASQTHYIHFDFFLVIKKLDIYNFPFHILHVNSPLGTLGEPEVENMLKFVYRCFMHY